jgi:hypothetical protein
MLVFHGAFYKTVSISFDHRMKKLNGPPRAARLTHGEGSINPIGGRVNVGFGAQSESRHSGHASTRAKSQSLDGQRTPRAA